MWSRVANFRRESLERELASGAVVKATVMRQTLHLVTRRDYGIFRAAMSETNFPWESALARRLAPSVRKLAAKGVVSSDEAIAYLERNHNLGSLSARPRSPQISSFQTAQGLATFDVFATPATATLIGAIAVVPTGLPHWKTL